MSEWVECELAYLCDQRKGINYKSEYYCDEDSGHPFLTIKSFDKGGGYDPTGIKYFDGPFTLQDRLFEGDILIAVTDLTRAGDIVGSPLRVPDFGDSAVSLASMDCMRLDPKPTTCDKSYLYYRMMLPDIRRQMVASAAGSTVLHLDTKRVPKMKAAVPKDPSHQKKIATILETVDEAIGQTEALIGKYEQVKAGMMHDLFTRGLTPDRKLRPPRDKAPDLYQETPIGWIPKDWGVAPFGSKVDVIDPNPSHRYPVEVLEGIPICSTENFDGENGFSFRKSKRVPASVYEQQNNRCQFKPLDVIFARKGKIGLARRYGTDLKVFSHTVVTMKPASSEVDAAWLLWQTRCSWFLDGIDKRMNTNSGVPTLGVDFIKNIQVPFPTFNEQVTINRQLDCISDSLESERTKLQKLRQQKSGLMQDLLTGKVPVKV